MFTYKNLPENPVSFVELARINRENGYNRLGYIRYPRDLLQLDNDDEDGNNNKNDDDNGDDDGGHVKLDDKYLLCGRYKYHAICSWTTL